jgi:hypothetical protein
MPVRRSAARRGCAESARRPIVSWDAARSQEAAGNGFAHECERRSGRDFDDGSAARSCCRLRRRPQPMRTTPRGSVCGRSARRSRRSRPRTSGSLTSSSGSTRNARSTRRVGSAASRCCWSSSSSRPSSTEAVGGSSEGSRAPASGRQAAGKRGSVEPEPLLDDLTPRELVQKAIEDLEEYGTADRMLAFIQSYHPEVVVDDIRDAIPKYLIA